MTGNFDVLASQKLLKDSNSFFSQRKFGVSEFKDFHLRERSDDYLMLEALWRHELGRANVSFGGHMCLTRTYRRRKRLRSHFGSRK